MTVGVRRKRFQHNWTAGSERGFARQEIQLLYRIAATFNPAYRRSSGDRRGQHSIRVNDRWRICFVWRGGSAWDVEVVDYH